MKTIINNVDSIVKAFPSLFTFRKNIYFKFVRSDGEEQHYTKITNRVQFGSSYVTRVYYVPEDETWGNRYYYYEYSHAIEEEYVWNSFPVVDIEDLSFDSIEITVEVDF